jgi:hypothetical protein
MSEMNSQERDALNAFLQQMTQAQVAQKDPEAEALITQAVAAQPHAGYLLVQRAMQLDYVLQQSQAKVIELQAELDRVKSGAKTSFLGDAYAWGRSPGTAAESGSGAPQAAPTLAHNLCDLPCRLPLLLVRPWRPPRPLPLLRRGVRV